LKKLIEKIEGEARLNFSFNPDKIIDFVDIEFFSSRGIEKILQNKNALDALVINPRVCGICGHAQLIATVQALEDCYDDITITSRAKITRELTLNLEIIQNHFKWFYFTIMPLLGYREYILKASLPSQLMAKSIATIAGQYPHTSYAIVGGIVSDMGVMDLVRVTRYIDETLRFFEDNLVHGDSQEFFECNNSSKLLDKNGDLPNVLNKIKNSNWHNVGKSYDRFIVFGENSYFKKGKSDKTRLNENIYLDKVSEQIIKNSYAKSVTYKDRYYEVGSLARAMIKKTPLIKDAHRRYGDSSLSRILARVCEIPQLLNHSKKLISKLNLNEQSYIKPKMDISQISSSGIGVVEASRGSLIHKVTLESGIIKNYDIITPTQWNLSNGTKDNLGVAQNAMVGLDCIELAELSFKSFDVCSVCTTH
jgi:hydrogenase large subunit